MRFGSESFSTVEIRCFTGIPPRCASWLQTMSAVVCLGLGICVWVVYCLVVAIRGLLSMRKPIKMASMKRNRRTVLIVLGSGGHTTEMQLLLASGGGDTYHFVYTNEHCRRTTGIHQNSNNFWWVPRSRRVGQSWLSSIFTTAQALPRAVWQVFRIRPDVFVCNGPGVCIPTLLGVILLNAFPGVRKRCPIVFIESICRTKNLSMTGQIIRPFATYFFVHWKSLLHINPRALWLSDPKITQKHRHKTAHTSMSKTIQKNEFQCLVTVGTTNFDRLLEQLHKNVERFFLVLKALKIKHTTIQIGGTSEFDHEQFLTKWSSLKALHGGCELRVVAKLPHSEFVELVNKVDLIIGHAGAGTAIEALARHKKLILIPNRDLMDDHQMELCCMLKDRHCLSCSHTELVGLLEQGLWERFDQSKKNAVISSLPEHLDMRIFPSVLETCV